MNPSTSRSSILGALVAATLSLPACQTADSGSQSAQRPRSSSRDIVRPAADDEFVTVSDGIRIDHRGWSDIGYRWEWSARPFGRGRTQLALVDPMGDRIAVQSTDSYTAVIQTSTGKTDWQVRNTSPLTDFVANERMGTTLISCARPEIYLMDINTGNLLARQEVELVVSSPPLIEGGLALFGTPVGRVICHRYGTSSGAPLPPPLEDGIAEWAYSLDGAINAAPVKIGNLAGVVTQKGQVFFVDIRTGAGRGTARIRGGTETDPVTDGTHMFVASTDQSIYAFVPDRGTYIWRERTADPITVQPTYEAGTLYCTLAADGLVAFDVSQQARDSGTLGTRRWENPEAAGEVVAFQNGDPIVWNAPDLHRVDVNTGDVIASLTLEGVESIVAGDPAEDSGDADLYAVGERGQLIRFSAR